MIVPVNPRSRVGCHHHRASIIARALCSGRAPAGPPEDVWIFRSSAATAATSVSRSARNRVASSSRADNADFAADKAAESFELGRRHADGGCREGPRRRAPRRAPRDPRGAWRVARGPPAMYRPRGSERDPDDSRHLCAAVASASSGGGSVVVAPRSCCSNSTALRGASSGGDGGERWRWSRRGRWRTASAYPVRSRTDGRRRAAAAVDAAKIAASQSPRAARGEEALEPIGRLKSSSVTLTSAKLVRAVFRPRSPRTLVGGRLGPAPMRRPAGRAQSVLANASRPSLLSRVLVSHCAPTAVSPARRTPSRARLVAPPRRGERDGSSGTRRATSEIVPETPPPVSGQSLRTPPVCFACRESYSAAR